MLLRASGATRNEHYDLRAIMSTDSRSGVPNQDVLLELVDATMEDDEERCARARETLVARLGTAALVDTAAIIATFNQADRTADGAGIPLDEPLELMTRELREELGVERFASAANSPKA